MIYGILILAIVVGVLAGIFWGLFRKPHTPASVRLASSAPARPQISAIPTSGVFSIAFKLYNGKSYVAAAEAYRQALEGSPDAFDAVTARYRLIECLSAVGKTDKAGKEAAALAIVLDSSPETASNLRVRGWLRRMQGDYLAAYSAFEQAIKASRPDEGLYYLLASELGSLSISLGRPDLTQYWAIHALSTGLKSDVHVSVLNLAGLGSRSLGDLDLAERYHNEAFEIVTQKGDAAAIAHGLANLALVNEERGHYDRAIAMAREAKARHPDQNDSLCNTVLVVTLAAVGQYEEAIQILEATIDAVKTGRVAITRDKRGSLGHQLAGITALTGDFPKAWRIFEETGSRPGFLQAIAVSTQGAWLASGLGRPDAADRLTKAYAEIESLHVHDAALRNHLKSLVRAAVILGDAQMATTCANRMLNTPQCPTNMAASWYYTGEAARIRGDLAEARRAYEQSIATRLKNTAVQKAESRLGELGLSS